VKNIIFEPPYSTRSRLRVYGFASPPTLTGSPPGSGVRNRDGNRPSGSPPCHRDGNRPSGSPVPHRDGNRLFWGAGLTKTASGLTKTATPSPRKARLRDGDRPPGSPVPHRDGDRLFWGAGLTKTGAGLTKTLRGCLKSPLVGSKTF
jgi:hypothetical protein